METSTMIRQLRRTAKKHENDKLHTFNTNISQMCTDVANRLEELEKENREIRNKAIDEFAERLKEKILEEIDEVSESQRNYEVGSDISTTYSHIIGTLRDVHHRVIDEIAEQLKAGSVNE